MEKEFGVESGGEEVEHEICLMDMMEGGLWVVCCRRYCVFAARSGLVMVVVMWWNKGKKGRK